MFRTILRRLVGLDDRAVPEEARLRQNLEGMLRSDQELSVLTAQLKAIIQRVEEQNKRQVSAAPSGFSGEHHLNLPDGVLHGPRT